MDPPRRIVYGKLYHRRSSRFQKRQRTTLRRAWTRGVIIWLVNFYRARTEHLFLLYEGHYTVAVPAHFSRERPLFLLSTFPRSLSRLLSTASSQPPPLFLFPWHRFTYRDKDLHRAYSWETRSSSFWCPFPAAFVQRFGLFFLHGFPWKIELNGIVKAMYIPILFPRRIATRSRSVSIYEFFGDTCGIWIEKSVRRSRRVLVKLYENYASLIWEIIAMLDNRSLHNNYIRQYIYIINTHD